MTEGRSKSAEDVMINIKKKKKDKVSILKIMSTSKKLESGESMFEAEEKLANEDESAGSPRITGLKGRGHLVYKPEWIKTFLAVLGFLIATSLNHLALSVIVDITSRNPLPDLSHSLWDELPIYRTLTDTCTTWGSLLTIFFCLAIHKHRAIVIRRAALICSVVYLMRAVTVCVTHIPPSYKESAKICDAPSQDPNPSIVSYFERFGIIFFTFGLQYQEKLFCGDMLFSGHTTAAAIACFFLNHYTPKSLWPLRIMLITVCVTAMVTAVLSRAHYTADVVLGYWISSLVFSFYHAFTYVEHKNRGVHRPFRRIFIFWIMYEMEKNVPIGRIPNDLDWPLPWPRFIKDGVTAFNRKSKKSRAGRLARFLTKYRLKLHV